MASYDVSSKTSLATSSTRIKPSLLGFMPSYDVAINMCQALVCGGVGTCTLGLGDGCKFGDVNGDCIFNALDILEIKKVILGADYDAAFADLSQYSTWQGLADTARHVIDPGHAF
jgi:hypothetical protein